MDVAAAASSASASASASAGRSNPSANAAQVASTIGVRGEEESAISHHVLSVIDSLKKKITADRFTYIKNKLAENRINLSTYTQNVYNLSNIRQSNTSNGSDVVSNWLTKRQDDALCSLHSLDICHADKDGGNSQDESSFSTSNAILGGNLGAKNAIRPIKLPEVEKLPPYTTWIFLDRNQRMSEDQSVLGRRRIYYDASCGEALICSDSEDEAIEDEEVKKEFKRSEDCIIRYEILHGEKAEDSCKKVPEHNVKVEDCDKDLDAALDSFDNLFCRRCLVFDCKLHGCSQDLVFPTEKQQAWNGTDDGAPCGIHCYKLAPIPDSVATIDSHMIIDVDAEPAHSSDNAMNQPGPTGKKHGSGGKKTKSQQSDGSSTARVASESSDSEVHPISNKSPQHSPSPSKVKIGPKGGIRKSANRRIAEKILMSVKKGQREVAQSDSNSVSGSLLSRDMKLRSDTRNGNKDSFASSQYNSPSTRSSKKKSTPQIGNNSGEAQNDSMEEMNNEHSATDGYDSSRKEEFVDESICKQEDNRKSWKVIEQGLLVKGLEIFGRNSCLIARNLLGGMKTCRDVFQYMNYIENSSASGALSGVDSLVKGYMKGNESRTRSRFFRRRGKVRRLKYTWKSAGYLFIRKRITERKDQPCRQYNPCGCQSSCGKQCPCLTNGTCCEKYCGCPKMCKNRFRGCHCAKSQCRSRQCPCFAADRECDPDVCRNCWVGCGDGTLGVPNQRGDNYECRNMKLLLKQQQRVLLGRSDVSGWGAFLKNSVGKHEYLGEYTGELISHKEADKRGKIYDRENSSFLFNLNNEYVLDAYRMGDKLKFANHSPDPNCYAKVIMVGGDHRVGIFAKERISAGEELFYDYRYEPDRAPAWARKPEAGGKDDGQPSNGRAKKLAQNTRA
ncbi:hypothetical protein EJB05_46039 [Eragrostis curvula]|uniref:Uncharacterized protein n=1 Tax=Eragrostis curvula TaxID=38414 RepID=A0A5J9TLV5_9POAL|nr:hypothetical protein EJB05_46039 [Eragrostis curvula]